MAKKILAALFAVCLVMSTSGCHEIEEYPNTGSGNFEQLWKLFDEHYCFFEERGIDWDSIYRVYQPRAAKCGTTQALFVVCTDMLDNLQDGHVNLSAWFQTYYYREWWSNYPQNYNERIVQENYLHFNYRQLGVASFGILPGNIGYLRIPTFEGGLGEGNLNAIFAHLYTTYGLVIDVRDNGGGLMDNVETVARRFRQGRHLAGYIKHKNGPGHNDFSEPYAYYYEAPAYAQMWTKPVVVLANRSTFSAANNFVSVMKHVPGVTVMGSTTGGGSGMPMSYELPCGWGVRMSACPLLDAEGRCSEFGVDPTEGYAIDITATDLAAGRDPILDAAIAKLTSQSGNAAQ